MIKYILSSATAIIAIYALLSFTKWDITWGADIPSWTESERAGLLMAALLFMGFAGVMTYASEKIKKP